MIKKDELIRAAKQTDDSRASQRVSPATIPQPRIQTGQTKGFKTIIDDRIREVKLKSELEKRTLAEN